MELVLNKEERNQLAVFLNDIVDNAREQPVDSLEWLTLCEQGWSDFPLRVRRYVSSMRRSSGPAGYLKMAGLPTVPSDLPPTPTATRESTQQHPSANAAFLTCVAYGLGAPVAYTSEKKGGLIHDVAPVEGREMFVGNAGSRRRLDLHVENAFTELRPDFVILSCLRADHASVAETKVGCISSAIRRLSDDTIATLAESLYITQPPPSFGDAAPAVTPQPLLRAAGVAGEVTLVVDFDATHPMNEKAKTAMGDLLVALTDAGEGMKLRPGEAVLVDNRVSVHGRNDFTPRYDGEDRWLQRVYAVVDPWRLNSVRLDQGAVISV